MPALFETGPGNGWLIGPWARRAAAASASFGVEIYRRLPNDTDFSILKRQGIPGLNFAVVGDSYAYHTTQETPERLSPVTLRESGDQIVALVTALDGVDITQRSPTERTFFDVASASATFPTARSSVGLSPVWHSFLASLPGCESWARRCDSKVSGAGCSHLSGRSRDRRPSSPR